MLSDTLKDIRRKNYLNQTEFANKIGVTQSAISQWEHGLTRPNSDQLKSISLAFGVSIDDLLKGEEDKQSVPDAPRTAEARILAQGVDKMPQEQREQALNIVRAVFTKYADYFEGGNSDDT